MGVVFPVGIKEPFEKLPPGYIKFKIDSIGEGNVGSEEEPVFGVEVGMVADAPEQVVGIPFTQRFYLGLRETDWAVQQGKAQADPNVDNPDVTLAFTAGRFKAFCAAAGVEIEGKETDLIYSELKDHVLMGHVQHKPSKDGERTFANVNRWLPENCGIEAHVMEVPAETPAQAKPAGKPAAAAGPRPNGQAAVAAKPAAAARPTVNRLGARTATATK